MNDSEDLKRLKRLCVGKTIVDVTEDLESYCEGYTLIFQDGTMVMLWGQCQDGGYVNFCEGGQALATQQLQ